MARSILFAVLCVLGLLPSVALAATHEVVGKSQGGKTWWEYKGMKSTPGDAGKPEGRLKVPVLIGDIVLFKVASGKHGVIFENAVPEMKSKVWEITAGADKLTEKRFKGLTDNALGTKPQAKGDILSIKVNDLKAGEKNGILFGCNPHSVGGGKVDMLGVIVLTARKRK